MSKKQVFIVSQVYHGCQSYLEKLLPSVSFKVMDLSFGHPKIFNRNAKLTKSDLDQLEAAEVMILDNVFLPDVFYSLPNLKYVQCTYAGMDGVLEVIKTRMKESNGQEPPFVASRFSGESFANLMFEYCLSHLIANQRGFVSHIINQHDKNWNLLKEFTPKNPRLISELTISVLGVGSIGAPLLRLFNNYGCKTFAFGRHEKQQDFLNKNGIDFYSTELEDVLKDTDCVINLLPHSPETAGLLNDRLSLCQNKPIFINIGRGSIIDESYLIQALNSDYISTAVLDVFQTEPLPPDNELWVHPKVIITPHVAAQRRLGDLALMFAENYKKFNENSLPLLNQIDWLHDY